MEQKEGHCGSFFSGLLKQVAKEVKSKANDSSKPAEPKQGHHIINKGVINIYEEIIGQFVRDHKYNYIFKGKSYEELKATKMMIDDRAKEALGFLFVNNPSSSISIAFEMCVRRLSGLGMEEKRKRRQ